MIQQGRAGASNVDRQMPWDMITWAGFTLFPGKRQLLKWNERSWCSSAFGRRLHWSWPQSFRREAALTECF